MDLLYGVLVVMISFDFSIEECSESEFHHIRTTQERCIRRGERFLMRYNRNLRHRQRVWSENKRCMASEHFVNCIAEFSSSQLCLNDTTVQTATWQRWKQLGKLLDCTCTDCLEKMSCFEVESRGMLSRKCDTAYRFNINNHPEHVCVFLQQNTACKTSLVTSACGDETRLLTYFLNLKVKHKRSQLQCEVSIQNKDSKQFHYSEQCRPEYSDNIMDCYDDHIKKTRLKFHDENDFILNTSNQLRDTCLDYNEYISCISRVSESCESIVNQVYSHQGQLRTYVNKLNVLCGGDDNATNAYTSSLPCYHQILTSHLQEHCDVIWRELSPFIKTVSAHQFYCQPQYGDTILVKRYLRELQECYQYIYDTSCPHDNRMLFQLQDQAFVDPFYLKYKYKPDCEQYTEIFPPESNSEQFVFPHSKPYPTQLYTNPYHTEHRVVMESNNAASFSHISVLYVILIYIYYS